MNPLRLVLMLAALSSSACARPPAPVATANASGASSGSTSTAAPTAEPTPSSALALVQLLRDIATGARPGNLDEHVDEGFVARLPSGDDLASLFTDVPEGCAPTFDEGPGYGAIAIPPPMIDDPPEEQERLEQLIDELAVSTEILAHCVVRVPDEEEEGATIERDLVLYAVAVHRDAHGRWKAMGWRNFLREDGNRH